VKEQMKKLLSAIRDGSFARTWIDENKSGRQKFLAMRKEHAAHQMEQVGEKLRSMMPWIAKNRLVNREKN
jgi:ketol-acid reductoisomerase